MPNYSQCLATEILLLMLGLNNHSYGQVNSLKIFCMVPSISAWNPCCRVWGCWLQEEW